MRWSIRAATPADVAAMRDLSPRELALLVPIALVVLWMGVYPKSFSEPMKKDVGVVLARTDRAWHGGDARLAKGPARPVALAAHDAEGRAH